ncbi:PilX N-terminal domain-containing pilus assembly protein [Methylomonas montana]|uniref:pilus assembly PilX family protein n=1 Tax=Methylomonas montana TaxID=3058963 RepID=UPI0026588A8C|nr:PilX N-terminal domain-containing pilus assembly protein [Methylomonas montana]WKJ89761.1 PilX N-terminal domain-containing pilus assembly protein [Methylomonas montana]
MFDQCLSVHRGSFSTPNRQAGVVLAVSLIMLLLLTLIGVTGARVTGLDEKMAGNMRDRNLAFQAAESALNAGETAAAATTISACPANPANPTGFYQSRDANCDGVPETTPIWNSVNWNTQSVLYSGTLADISTNPRYIVEDMGLTCVSPTTPCPAADQRRNFRITARATGGTADSVVMLQSIYQVDVP